MITIEHEKMSDGRIAISPEDFEDIMDVLMFDDASANAGENFPIELLERLISQSESPVKIYREYRGYTQSQLAKKVDVAQNTISDIENGKKDGSTKTLKKIAIALDVDLDDLV